MKAASPRPRRSRKLRAERPAPPAIRAWTVDGRTGLVVSVVRQVAS